MAYTQADNGLSSLAENALAQRPPMQPPQGSPLPYDLAQMLAKQKVLKEAVDAQAHQMMQQSAGQGKPPVDTSLNEKLAQLFKPPQQQAGPDLQQAAMGPGMNNQGMAPPNSPPPGAQPPGPPQRMAAGGLASLPTHLPQSYAGGGIIAFAEGKKVEPPEMYAGDAMKGVSAKATESKDTSDMSPVEAWIASLNKYGKGVKASPEDIARTRAAIAGEAQAVDSAATPPPPPPPPSPNSAAKENKYPMTGGFKLGSNSDSIEGLVSSALTLPAEDQKNVLNQLSKQFGADTVNNVVDAVVAKRDAASNEAAPTAAAAEGAPPSAPPVAHTSSLGKRPEATNTAFLEKLQTRLDTGMDISPNQVRADRVKEADTEYGGLERAMRARQAVDIQKQREADAEQLKQSDPNTWGRWLSRFDPNAQSFGAGVAAKTYAEQDAHQAMKQKQLAGLRGLQDAQEAGNIGDVKSRYALGDAARAGAEKDRAGFMRDATSLVNAQEAALGHKQTGWDTAQSRIEAAQQRAADNVQKQADKLSAKEAATLLHTRELAMRQATDAATKFSMDMMQGVSRPGETADTVFTNTFNRAMSTVPGFVPVVVGDVKGTKLPPPKDPVQAAALAKYGVK